MEIATIIIIITAIIGLIGCIAVSLEIKQQRKELKQLGIDLSIARTNVQIKKEELELLEKRTDMQDSILQGVLEDINKNLNTRELTEHDLENAKDKLNTIKQAIIDTNHIAEQNRRDFEAVTAEAAEQYFEELEKDYEKKNAEYEKQCAILNSQLEDIRNSIKAKVEAAKRQEQITDNKDNYRLNLSDKELRDIKVLNSIKDDLSNPAAVNKIIWSNYYQPLAKIKFPKIIGKATTCGIYKLTNTVTGEGYVGQALDIYKRWNDHCKDGLGAGTKAASAQAKLYGNIRKYGLSNFTFEVLEECPSVDLNRKEKEYISLYDTFATGLNATQGNN